MVPTTEAVRELGARLIGPELAIFPVRHHSPACAWHINRLIRELKPDAVLIEGPRDASGIIPNPNSCTDFKWNATSQTATTAAGSFTTTCTGIVFAGTASGTLTGTTVAWSANGTAFGESLPVSPCAITLTGTAELGTNSIRVPYSGNTCLGPVTGVQILNKR
jgi:hypothetical protein